MDKATYGLIGVALGFILTVVKDWLIQHYRKQKDIEYLCIHTTCMLDRFVAGCSDVVGDDGLSYGQPDKDGYSRIKVSTPAFEPEKLEVEWKSLPANIMYEILNFPLKIEAANSVIDSTFEHVASPLDYSEGFEERQYQYAVLGSKADALALKLRSFSKLPNKEVGDWDLIQLMKDKKLKIEKLRKERFKHQENMFNELSTPVDCKESLAQSG